MQRTLRCTFYVVIFFVCLSIQVNGQRIALVTPDEVDSSKAFAERLETALIRDLTILDRSMSKAAFLASSPSTPFNLTTEASRTLGSAMGCDQFILLRSATIRRSAFGRAEYYESYAAIYLVSTRTGRLSWWNLSRFEAAKASDAEQLLNHAVPSTASELANAIRSIERSEAAEGPDPVMEEPPSASSAPDKTFRAPIPYKRIKPEYTVEAALFDVTATVDILVDLDAAGSVLRTRIVRWAGFGLDRSVEAAVKKMNWRPAERNGRFLPMRFLLRYNFKKADSEKG